MFKMSDRLQREVSRRFGRGTRRVLVALSSAALVGCSSLASERVLPSPASPASVAVSSEPSVSPAREFKKEELFRLLVAEFAANQGDLALAVSNYVAVAKESRDPGVAERAMRFAIYAKDEVAALEAAELWTEISPEEEQVRQVYGALLLRSGRLEEAVAQFETILATPGERADRGFDAISELLSREQNREAALDAMARLVSGRETNPHALFAYAKLAARAGEVEKALELLERLLDIDNEHAAGSVLYARLLQQRGNLSDALDALAQTLETTPSAQAVRMTYARLLIEAKRFDEARVQFERVLADDPENLDVRYALGLLLLQTNRPEDARAQFLGLTDNPPRRAAAYYYLGQIDESQEKYDQALEEYRRVDRGEHFLNAQIRVAVILAKQGAIEQARDHLHALPRQNAQQDIRIFRAEAEILANSDRLEEAMDVYDRALVDYGSHTDLLYARAMLAEKLDRLDVLESDLRTILENEPDNADALNALGFTLADRTDRYEEALELISRALELRPDDFYILDSMGWVMYRIGRYREALEYLRRALSLSEDPEVAAHLGEVLWTMGEKDAAREVWATALQTTPDDQRLLEVIKRFTD